MNEFIGPVLPVGLKPANSTDSSSDSEEGSMTGPSSTEHINCETKFQEIGPLLPSNLSDLKSNSDTSIAKSENHNLYGPKLPPNFVTDCGKKTLTVGQDLPPGINLLIEDSEEDESFIGPTLPNSVQSTTNDKIDDFERRSQKMKDKLLGKTDKRVQRESWMTELPEDRAKVFGPGARTFMRRAPDMQEKDTSDWTDTPADRERKSRNKESKSSKSSLEKFSHHKRDEEIATKVLEHNKDLRSESLVDLHKKKKQKTDAAEIEPKQRQPFDREKDLQVNRFDAAQKKSIMKKAKELNSRFSHSTVSSSFL